MTTYRYCIEQHEDGFRVSEADGPNAPATGTYNTLDEAKDAVLKVSGRTDLHWEHGGLEVLPVEILYWATEWDEKGNE